MFETCGRIYDYIKNMHFVDSYYIDISQCTVEKKGKDYFGMYYNEVYFTV